MLFFRQSMFLSGWPVHTAVEIFRVKPTSQVEPTSKFVVPVFAPAGAPIRSEEVVPPLNVCESAQATESATFLSSTFLQSAFGTSTFSPSESVISVMGVGRQ